MGLPYSLQRLPFGDTTARRLKLIASNPTISNRAHVHDLPSSWRTLYELSRLPEPTLHEAFESGSIRPDMERKHAKQFMPVERARVDADFDSPHYPEIKP